MCYNITECRICGGEGANMADLVVKKSNKLGAKVWSCIIIFGLIGQLAWMVENVYFSTFIQKNITTASWATSATVAASAVVAALATIFGGAWTDRLGKRKMFICIGYILWGVATACFAFFGDTQVSGNITLIVTLFVIMDCVMTVFGSVSNDAAFSAWVTDVTDITNRGITDVVLSIMPVAALMLIFGAFDGLTQSGHWTVFFIVLGGMTTLFGVLGLFLFKDSPKLKPNKDGSYLKEVAYGFTPSNIKKHGMIYVCLIGMMFSGLAMQLWQPYMITLIQYTLGIYDYILPMAIIVLVSAGLSVVGGKMMDKYGKEKFFYPVAAVGVVGGIVAYCIKFVNQDDLTVKTVMLCIGGTLIMAGSLMMGGVFNATARDYTPDDKAGCFQGVKIIIFVMLPMVLASIINPLVINGFGVPVTDKILAMENCPYNPGELVYPYEMFLFSAIAAVFVFIPAFFVRRRDKQLRRQKLAEIHADVAGLAETETSADDKSDNG